MTSSPLKKDRRAASVSACIIAKNEADRISACLESVAFCDEIVVLDSGSQDGTPELCRQLGARVIETDWPGWRAQKHRAAEAATHDWILSVDADERLDDQLRLEIERLRTEELTSTTSPAAYAVNRKNFYDGKWIQHGGWFPQWRVRLFDRNRAKWGGPDPHERVVSHGAVHQIRKGHLEHRPYRSLSDHLHQIDLYSQASAAASIEEGRKVSVSKLVLHPPLRFLRAYFIQRGLLDGELGFVLAVLSSYSCFLKYARQWELQHGPSLNVEPQPDPSAKAGSLREGSLR